MKTKVWVVLIDGEVDSVFAIESSAITFCNDWCRNVLERDWEEEADTEVVIERHTLEA